MTGEEKHTRGIVATILFHSGLVLLLVLFGFHTPLPLPEEQALLINFGTDQGGSGLVEPSPTPPPSTPPPVREEPRKEEVQQPKEKIVTQDIEEAAAVESGKKKEPDKPTAEELRKKREKELAKKKAQEELERKRKAEEERRRREEEERKRREAEERKKQEILNRTKNAFSNARGTADTKSEGETGGRGNQGVKEGSPQAGAHSGTPGGGGKGISYSLAGRKPLKLPKPQYNYQEEGVVVVEVTVDRNGKVTKAIPGVKGSTTLNDYLLKVAKKAALASTFDRKPDAPAYQKGTITYHFILK